MCNSFLAIVIFFGLALDVTSAEKEWMAWSEWTTCSTTCEFGLRQRVSRLKNDDGSMSNSTKTDHMGCLNDVMCPVAGNWTMWSPWSHCSMPCGMGQQKRVRHCANPTPAYEGANCVGPDEQTRECKKQRCPPIPADFSMDMCADEHRIFLCRSATQCVNKTFVCDRKVHCHDGSDEMSCYRYHSPNASVSLQSQVSTVITTVLCVVFAFLSS